MSLYESLVSNIGIGMPVINKKTFIEWLTERNSNLEDVFKRWWFSGIPGNYTAIRQIDQWADKELQAQGYDINDCDMQIFDSYVSVVKKYEVGVIRYYRGEGELELVLGYMNDSEMGIIDIPAAKKLFDELDKVFKKYHKVIGKDDAKLTPYRAYDWKDSKSSIKDLF